MISRLETIQQIVDDAISKSADVKRNYVHSYGVSNCSAVLAIKRGLNPELASVAGMLHDISYVVFGNYDNHTELGAHMAEKIMKNTGRFTFHEIGIVTQAILRHDDRHIVHDPYDEVLKDADILHPYLIDVTKKPNPNTVAKLLALFLELDLIWRVGER